MVASERLSVGYLRCSPTEQATDGLSLDAQRGRIAAWCEATGARFVEVVEEAGVSGARALAERPGGARIARLLITTVAGKSVEDADEQAVLGQIHRLRTDSVSCARIAADLNAAGTPAKRGGDWHVMSVRSVARTAACVLGAEAA